MPGADTQGQDRLIPSPVESMNTTAVTMVRRTSD